MSRLLLTADRDESTVLVNELEVAGWEVSHLPLQQYHYQEDPELNESVVSSLDQFRFVLYGGYRNARYFFHWVEEHDKLNEVQQFIHLAMNSREAGYLEERGIPVIVPAEGGRPIDLMEFLLRISAEGAVLYPGTDGEAEEIPGLLEELGMPRAELTVCGSMPLSGGQLNRLREQIKKAAPDVILFHNRSSVIRTRRAFPDLDLSSCRLIAASEGVAWKMNQEGLQPDMTAGGTWVSVQKLLQGDEKENN